MTTTSTPAAGTDAAAAGPGPATLTPAAPVAGRYDRSIIEGPLRSAVWKLAWPTMLTNIIGGLQGIVDHVLVGHLVGFRGNAAIGVAWQIFIIVIVFITSLFTGMSVLVARFAGANDHVKVDRTVYQAFLTAIGISLLIMAPLGYFLAPTLLDLVNAKPEVQAEALPFLRVMFLFSSGMMVFFMLSGALRAAGDSRTPMVLGVAMTVLNLVLNVVLIRGLGPIPAFGTVGSAMGTVIASGLVALYAMVKLWTGGWVVAFPRGHGFGPDWGIIRSLFRFGLPTGIQGIAMNIGGMLMLAFIGSLAQSAAAQAAFAVSYSQLFSLITWTSVGLMGAAAAVAGQNLGAGQPDRADEAVHVAARIALAGAAVVGIFFLFFPKQLLGVFGMNEPVVLEIGAQLLRVLSLSGLFIAVALTYTGGLQGTGDTRSPLYISIISQIIVPLGICFVIQQTGTLDPIDIWVAILIGHAIRCGLSVLRFNQGKWRSIIVDLGPSASALAIALLLVGCASGDRSGDGPTIDTLPSGTVVVRNSEGGGWDSSDAWRVTEITRVGGPDADSATAFGRVAGFALDEGGRLYVGDGQALVVRVFDWTGHLVRTIGRKGQGPGEFELITGVRWGPDDMLWVADPDNDRYTLFDSTGRVVRTVRRTVGGYGGQWDAGFDDRGRLVEPSRTQNGSFFVRHTVDSTGLIAIDSFPLPQYAGKLYRIDYERGGLVMAIPFAPSMTWRYDGHEGYWSAISDQYRLVRRSFSGDTLRIVERPFTPIPVTAAERSDAEKTVSNTRNPRAGAMTSPPPDLSLIPATKPVFETFVVDESGHLWVARTASGAASASTATAYDVFDPDGVFLGSVPLAISTRPTPVISAHRIVGVARDSLGTESVVVYRLDRR